MTATTQHQELPAQFHQHMTRPEWGLAIFAGNAPSGRKYQFEDGNLRTIGHRFEHLMAVAKQPDDGARRMAELTRKLGVSSMRAETGAADMVSTTEQIETFRAEYPGAFRDPRWVKEVRGLGVARPTKKHRDAAIARAQEHLAADRLRAQIDAARPDQVIASLVEVLERTDMVDRSRDVTPLTAIDGAQAGPLAEGLLDLLHGPRDIADRVDLYVAKLEAAGVTPTWLMVTTPLALMFPKKHVAVRPTCFRRQAKWMGLDIEIGARPSGATYFSLLQVAIMQESDLRAAGLQPRDLVSIHDFMRRTTRVGSKKDATADA